MISLNAEATPSADDTDSADNAVETASDRSLTLEERVIQWTVTVLVPLLITFIAFGVIILAYGEWKLY